MITCFPASNDTNVYHCDTVSNRSSPSHFTMDGHSNISQVRTRPTMYKQFMPLLGKPQRMDIKIIIYINSILAVIYLIIYIK